MEITPAVQIFAFVVFSLIAIAGALGMATTMSMFRSGIFLMASFIGVAGLFILLLADLLGLLQVMMYIGGMLVMILFMVLFSQDPGGEMMTGMMELPFIEKFFSLGLAHKEEHEMTGGNHQEDDGQKEQKPNGDAQPEQSDGEGEHNAGHDEKKAHGGHSGNGDHGGMQDMKDIKTGGMDNMDMSGMDSMDGMDMSEMSMTTPIKKQAVVLAVLVGLLLGGLVLLRPAWRVTNELPDQNSPQQIGEMLMGKYMIAFEGAGLLILLGIFGAVMVSRPAEHTDARERAREKLQAAVDENPSPVATDPLVPFYETDLPRETEDGEEESKREASGQKKKEGAEAAP